MLIWHSDYMSFKALYAFKSEIVTLFIYIFDQGNSNWYVRGNCMEELTWEKLRYESYLIAVKWLQWY